ncbi:MAG: DEAD/DEAH box helicase [Myxococcota bacterium]
MIPLGDRIPSIGLSDDALLEAFLGWVSDRGLEPYPAQEEAVLELLADQHVILATPTGSGKSLVATALHAIHLARGERSVYTAPIKALVAEKFFELARTFGADRVGMMTGDGSVNRDAPILCCTAEILAKMALRDGADVPYEGIVMDEFHYYGDPDRGMAWHVPLITMAKARFLLMSATLGSTAAIEESLLEVTGREVTVVRGTTRPVPLTFDYRETPLLQTLPDLLASNKAPIYCVHFAQAEATKLAQALLSTPIASADEKAAIKKAAGKFRFDTPFGRHLKRMVLHGVGLHHAGLLPKYRMLVERMAQQGLFKVICGTDTLGVGINVPIRTVLFTQLCKYDGHEVNLLKVRDFQQISGRAGRKGFDDEGLVVAQAPAWIIENARTQQLVQAGKKKRPKVKAQPPSRGYRHWDQAVFERMSTGLPEPLKPVFTLDHGAVLARLQRAEALGTDPMDELDALIDASHVGRNETARLQAEARERIQQLVLAGIVEPVQRDGIDQFHVYEDLQEDFDLYHALSLFLVHSVALLDRESPTYGLDVLSCVESVLEHPRVLLHAQVRLAKTEKIAELKAEGVPYEERLEALEEVTYPKPLGPWLYLQFELWRTTRPWIQGEAVRPKGVARELVELLEPFTTAVKRLQIDRSEGVLLRYLSQVYKTMLRGVPIDAQTEPVLEVLAFLRALLARVDDSLITSWEDLRSPTEVAVAEVEKAVDISEDLPRFRARIRAELHALVRALAVEDWDEAAATVRNEADWDANAMRAGVHPFVEEFGPIAFDHRARMAWHTILRADGDHRWLVSQRLVPADVDVELDDTGWTISGEVDLTEDTNPTGPLVRVFAVGE